MNARVLLTGILIGAILALVIGAATGGSPQTGHYQIAATTRSDGPPYIFRLDTYTGAIEACRCPAAERIPTGAPIQIIQPR